MEPPWREAALKQSEYFTKAFQQNLDYDRSTREYFHAEIKERFGKYINPFVKIL